MDARVQEEGYVQMVLDWFGDMEDDYIKFVRATVIKYQGQNGLTKQNYFLTFLRLDA